MVTIPCGACDTRFVSMLVCAYNVNGGGGDLCVLCEKSCIGSSILKVF